MASFGKAVKYNLMKDVGAPFIMMLSRMGRKKRRRKPRNHLGPPLRSNRRLKKIMGRHYFLSRYAKGAKPVAWVTSGAPVELLRPFGFYTVYPENHGALCGAQRMGPELCSVAEEQGYHQDLCSYARIDLGVCISGNTPVGRLPQPDILFASNNICQTVLYWYKVLAHHWKIPLLIFDTPYNFQEITDTDVTYMVRRIEEIIPVLERESGTPYDHRWFKEYVRIGKETSEIWGEVLATMKAKPAPMTIFDSFAHLAPIVSLRGLPVARDHYIRLLQELRERIDQGIAGIAHEGKRLMWDNIAIWYKVREFETLFAERGMNFVAATYTNAWAETAPYMHPERPLESMARTYSLVILNNNLNHRLKLMERLIKEYHVDGLVIHSAKSCKPYSVGQYDLKRLLMKRLNVPSVVLEADIADSRAYSEEQARTRLEAFFETLET